MVETRQPSESGGVTVPAAGAGTWRTRFYTAGVDPVDAACGNRPEWNGLACTSGPAVLSGAQTRTRVSGYTMWLAASGSEETTATAGVARYTVTGFDGAGRPVTTSTGLVGIGGSTPPSTTTGYSPTTGLVVSVSSGAASVVTGYDGWGRAVTYAPSGQSATTTTYDGVGRVVSVVDPKGSTVFGYGLDAAGRVENRGMATSVTHTTGGVVVSVSGAYDGAGNLVEQVMAGGVMQSWSYDTAGEPVGLVYAGPDGPDAGSDPDPWLGWAQSNDVSGRVVAETTPNRSDIAVAGVAGQAHRAYSYNGLGQLVGVVDHVIDAASQASLSCTMRSYTFTGNGARAGVVSATAGPGLGCGGVTVSGSRAWTVDAADRVSQAVSAPGGQATLTGVYAYDALGRVTTLPAVDTITGAGDVTLTYRGDDSVESISQAGVSQTFGYDISARRVSATTTGPGGTRTLTRGYADTSDNPAWTVQTRPAVSGPGTQTTTTRYLAGLDAGLIATTDTISDLSGTGSASTVMVTNPHGDITATIAVPATGAVTGIESWHDSDEYGNPTTSPPAAATSPAGGATPAGYGWWGSKERSADTPAGLTLMGARLYNPVTATFTSTDPEYGGGDTTYTHPTDPINTSALDGRRRLSQKTWKRLKWLGIGLAAAGCVFTGAIACIAMGMASAAISARADAGRWGGSNFRNKFRTNAKYALLGGVAGKAIAMTRFGSAGASVTRLASRNGLGRGMRTAYNFLRGRPMRYRGLRGATWHSTRGIGYVYQIKLNIAFIGFSNR